ncbi:alcohol dehydrogenase [Thioclava sp. SK-1]|uniref:c-type cytochrome n=1 Tax=Thioclava sp. SK-1 TaxID=1889770 RepID=UPI0008260C12|nr:c-type cytochrome [Thioclava sp. SK-1]OCX65643.1 alcohol dehydrogenase [Thioclava sp. SK-1]
MSAIQHIAFRITAGVVVLALIGGGGWAWKTLNTSRSAVADDQVTLAEFTTDDEDAIARGNYIMRLGDCAACHTRDAGEFAGGYQVGTPFGTLVSSNITPDPDTGIGTMTERDFFNAMRHGQGSKGMLYPAMPYTDYAKLTDQDMHDLWAYMSTLTPISHNVDEDAGMSFPFNIRLAMAGWNALFFDNSGFTPDDTQSPQWNRGAYIVEGPGHCSACHTPRNALGGEIASRHMQGAVVDGWFAPEITSNPHVGLGDTPTEDVARYLKTGSDGVAFAAGPMAEAVEDSTQYMTQDDLLAVAQYLKSLPGSPAVAPAPIPASDTAMQAAAQSYEVNCSACHGLSGEGIKALAPGFAGNHALLSENATNPIRAVLVGARAAHSHMLPTGAGMPSFAWKMDDQDIADVLNYIRNSWGNAAEPIGAAQVSEARATLGARDKIIWSEAPSR